MTFKITEARVDLITGMAVVVAVDQTAGSPTFKSVSAQFPFKPPGSEAQCPSQNFLSLLNHL